MSDHLPAVSREFLGFSPLPDGLSLDDIRFPDLAKWIARSPEQAMIVADCAVKYQMSLARRSWAITANMLYVVSEAELWRLHPAGFSSFFEWCMQPEIDLAASTVSNMLSVVRLNEVIRPETGIDLFDVIEEIGPSKVQRAIPRLREAIASDMVEEMVPELIDAVKTSSYRELDELLKPEGSRMEFDPAAVYADNGDGTHTITFTLDWDGMDPLARKVGVRRWFDETGHRIEAPTNMLPGG